MPYTVGLTGGIGSGKSAVAELFARHGVAVVDCDEIAHQLTQAGGAAIGPIREAFGPGVIGTDGSLDRVRMRALAFGDDAQRRKLEAILHPLIRKEGTRRVGRAGSAYAVLVVPLLVEAGIDRSRYARVIVVDCTEAQQIERVMLRSGLPELEVRAIIGTQARREERLARADDVIDNSGAIGALESQVNRLHEKYLSLAGKPRPA